jgi:HlyD family secretion protein
MKSTALVKCKQSLFALLVLLVLSLVSGCSAFAQASPAPLPTVVLDNSSSSAPSSSQIEGGGVTASGVVAPAQQAQLASLLGGSVQTVNVSVGDKVQAGQVLLVLAGGEKLSAAVEAANLELFSAQQAYDDLFKNLEADQNQALQKLNGARQAVRDAERQASYLGGTADKSDIQIARSQLIFAENALKDAQDKFKRFEKLPEDNLARARYQVVVADAQKEYDQALRKYNSLTGTPSNFDLNQAQTALEIAQKGLELAQKDYDLLQQGPDPDLVKAAQARIDNAKAQYQASQSALDDLELTAPFAGTVAELSVQGGEWVIPGQPILVLADLDHLQIQTTDLSERDVPQVKTGQAVTVFVKALNQNLKGKVTEISPLADTLGGDVVYKTTIDLDSIPDGLRSGMSVEVQFGQ